MIGCPQVQLNEIYAVTKEKQEQALGVGLVNLPNPTGEPQDQYQNHLLSTTLRDVYLKGLNVGFPSVLISSCFLFFI